MESENSGKFGQPSSDLTLSGKYFLGPLPGWWPSISVRSLTCCSVCEWISAG